MEFHKQDRPMKINYPEGSGREPVEVLAGQTVYTDSTGFLEVLKEGEDLSQIAARVDAEIAKNIADAEALEAAHPEPTPEEP